MDDTQTEIIEAAFQTHYSRLVAYAEYHLGSKELAEEAVQEVFRAACAKPQKVIDNPNVSAWLFTALKLEIKKDLRCLEKDRKIISELTIRNRAYATIDETMDIDTIYPLQSNTPDFELMRQIALEGKSHLELSRELGISLSACKKRAQRARDKLRKLL